MQNYIKFECHMYVGARGDMRFNLPQESGPKKVARLVPLRYDELVAPDFRRLLAAFNPVTAV
ncbi:MAG: hypothetical protein K0S68_47 [Candidatus Saccharibacteria bacterium]|nr:hypothetical protein [Candidatus Saccharibacteria bacterium]